MHQPPEEGGVADEQVDLTLADGTLYADLRADDVAPGDARCLLLSNYGGFYYCRKEVTNELRAQGAGHLNGTYTLAGLDSHEGDCELDPHCQARYGAFALVVVWESPSHGVTRDVVLYDGFLAMQERNNDPEHDFNGVTSFTLSGFTVGEPYGELALCGFEGDNQLGAPPLPDTNGDFFKLEGTPLSTLSGPGQPENPPYNLWNSSEGLGVDIDRFDIGETGLDILETGQTSLEVELGSGDGVAGVVNAEFVDHDMVVLGWIVLAVDALGEGDSDTDGDTDTDSDVDTDTGFRGFQVQVLDYVTKSPVPNTMRRSPSSHL